ncbi:predicted protein [Lichtheimia corymbifera JMRC:FSU:9682]|uniref:Uncharacterized protein n=1 Tax=Lichtheimia corymbifera JMRC:FSU:9682 TaxID=1263082 RepID=A0A068S292_9FUNG|nr:predicted protein [Lichtheimia corymbifera JMRC:FSU:9682]CDH61373.1 predicted protein [Lichtheimia corymbifera JMRC:FSU:9682]
MMIRCCWHGNMACRGATVECLSTLCDTSLFSYDGVAAAAAASPFNNVGIFCSRFLSPDNDNEAEYNMLCSTRRNLLTFP